MLSRKEAQPSIVGRPPRRPLPIPPMRLEANGDGTTAVAAARWSAKGKDWAALGGIATHEFVNQADGSLKLRLQLNLGVPGHPQLWCRQPSLCLGTSAYLGRKQMSLRHETAGIDRERRAAVFLLALAGVSAATVGGGGREVLAQRQAGAAGGQDARQAVEAFVAKYLEVYNKKDAAGVASLYTEDGLLVPPGPIVTGRQNIEKAWQAVFDTGRTGLRYDIQQVQAEGNIVWSVGRFTVMVPDEKGGLQERQGNFANIYQWEGEGLKFRVHAFSFLPVTRPR
jgi:uncharacterized protein (TIGR02246 family)